MSFSSLCLKIHCRHFCFAFFLQLIDSKENLASFSRSITVPKEAFEKSTGLNNTVPFAAFLTFKNLTKVRKNISNSPSDLLHLMQWIMFLLKSFFKDGMDSNVLGGEVLAIEMGASITNLTDQISINFRNTDHVSKRQLCIRTYGVYTSLSSLNTPDPIYCTVVSFVNRREFHLVAHGMEKVNKNAINPSIHPS